MSREKQKSHLTKPEVIDAYPWKAGPLAVWVKASIKVPESILNLAITTQFCVADNPLDTLHLMTGKLVARLPDMNSLVLLETISFILHGFVHALRSQVTREVPCIVTGDTHHDF